jgi:hypothetical protein
VGRGNGALVDLESYRGWRQTRRQPEADTLYRVATALQDVLKRDGGLGEPAHVSLGISRRSAAALLACAWWRVHRALTGGLDARDLPPEIERAMREMAT